jgi:AraC-like DNA-binding protein
LQQQTLSKKTISKFIEMQTYNLSGKEKSIIHNSDELQNDTYNCCCHSVSQHTTTPDLDNEIALVFSSEIKNSNTYEFIYITEGEGVCNISNQPKQTVATGCFAMIRPGQKAVFTPSKNKKTAFFHASVSGLQYTLFLEKVNLFQQEQIVNIGQNVIIEGIFQNLIQVQKDQKKGAQALLATSIFHILSVVNFKILNYNDRENPILLKINEAKEILRNDIEAKISPEEVAERIGISYSLFRRIFKENVGISPAQYQMDIRLKRAQELLATTNYSIAKIAGLLGFTDTAQFSTFFRKRQNMTPRDYRNKYK